MAVLRAYTLQDLFANLAGSINSNSDTSSQFEVVDNFVNASETLILNGTVTPPSFTTSTNYPANVAGDYPTSYWRLAENAATGSAVDSNQNLLSAYPRITSSSMTSITQHATSFLAHSGASQFTASTSSIVFNNAVSLQLAGDLTVEFWVNLASLGSSGTSYGLVTKDGATLGSGEYGVYFHNTSGAGQILYAHNGYAGLTGGTLSTGTWYHVAVTRVAATKTVTIYVNGSSVATGTYVTAPSATDNNVVLGNHTGVAAATTMSMTEAALYPQALTSVRVSAHYAWGVAPDATATAYGGTATLYGEFPYPAFNAPTANAYGSASSTWGSFIWDGGTGAGGTMSGVAWFNVRDYGAIGNGVHDDTTAINSAITACVAAGGGVVYFPYGTYAVTPGVSTAAITLNNGSTGYAGVRLFGDSSNSAKLKKLGNGVLISMSGPSTDLTGATHCKYCSIENMTLDGGNFTGLVLQTYYADNLYFRDVHFQNNNDTGHQTTEFWDSRFINCVFDSLGSSTANATAPATWLANTVTGSGFGTSTDTVNQIYFWGCRWENFTTGGIRIERGPGGGTGQPTGIFFTDCKIETVNLNGGNHVFVDTPCQDIHFKHIYAYSGGFHAAYSTAQDVFSFSPQVGTLDDVFIFNASGSATIANGVTINSPLASGTVALENVRGKYTTAPTGAHVNFGGTNTGAYKLNGCSSDNGTQFGGTAPTGYSANQTLTQAAGVISDSSFVTTPLDGTQGIDTLNKRLYTRHSSGTWSRIPLNTIASSVTSTTTVSASGLSTFQASSNAAANEPQAGSVYVMDGYGVFTATGSQTIAFTLFWGTTAGTSIASIPAITPANLTNASFSYRCILTFRSTTSVTASITLDWATSTTTDAATRYTSTPSTATTVTTTGATPITVGVTWSNTGSSISLMGGLTSKIN